MMGSYISNDNRITNRQESMVRVRDFQHSFLLYCNAQKVNSLNTETTVEFGSNDRNTIDNPPIIDLDEFDTILEKTTSKINDNEYDPLNNREVSEKELDDINDIINKDLEKENKHNASNSNCTLNNLNNTMINNSVTPHDDSPDKDYLHNIDADIHPNGMDEKQITLKTKTNKETVNIDVISINTNDEVAGFESNNVNCSLDIISLSSTDSMLINNDKILDLDENITEIPAYDIEYSAVTNGPADEPNNETVNMKVDVNDDSDNCSYHSSDFEFITEEEANIDGFIINFRAKTVNKKQAELDKLKNASGINFHRHYLPGTSRVEYADEFSYRENHIIPEGDEYLSLFQGIYAPVFAPLHFMENKSVRSNCMNVEFEGIGFDMKLLNKKNMEDTTEEAYKEEAEESARKILEMYPADNRKRRRF